MSSSAKYHLGKASYVLNMIDGLTKEGVNVQKLINKSSLRYFQLDDLEAMIPIHVMYEFFELVQKDQSIDQMGLKFQQLYSVNTIGVYGALLASSKKILSTILNSQKYEKLNFTHDNNEFKILNGKSSFYGNRYGAAPCKGQDFLSTIDHSIQLEVIKNSSAPGWNPLEIHLIGDDSTYVEKIFPNCKSKILLNQEKYGLVFKTEALSNSLLFDNNHNAIESDLQSVPKTLSAKIEHLFDTFSLKYLPGIKEVASIFNISESTLKRNLDQEDVSFSQLLERWRFTKAIELLTKSDHKINEIGDRLFYSNSANFIRAFKRWSGLSPTDFR